MPLPKRKTNQGQFPGEGVGSEPLTANILDSGGCREGVLVQKRGAEQGINSVYYAVQVSHPHSGQQKEKGASSFSLRAFPRREAFCFCAHIPFIRSQLHGYKQLQGKLQNMVFIMDGYTPSHQLVVQLLKHWRQLAVCTPSCQFDPQFSSSMAG